jgi:hypothetical protein
MWPFKRKLKPEAEPSKVFKSILCIPGNWKSREDFILLVVQATNGEYIAAANILLHPKSNQHFKIEFCTHDEKMRTSFEYAGRVNSVSETFLSEIENHKHVIYLIGTGGSIDDAEQIARAGHAILKAGGLGVKVETAGKAFESQQWIDLIENCDEANLYKIFVLNSIVNQAGETYSCGMHNLGLKDTIIDEEDFQESVYLINIFSIYQLVDKPIIQEGQTFSCEIDAPKFRITTDPQQPNSDVDLFNNPFGMWRLSRM